MWRWWRAEDLDPKFRILLVLLVVQLLVSGVAMHVYVFPNRTPPLSVADSCVLAVSVMLTPSR